VKQTEPMQQERHTFTLRFTQFTEGEDKYRVEIALKGSGLARQTVTNRFDFKLTDQDQEDIRWYLEDFLQYPHDPAPQIAARIEERMAEIGTKLFKALFHSSDDARDLWATLRARLNETCIEIVTTVAEATTLPWELIRDPKTDTPLPLRARSFVHAHPQAAQVPKIPEPDAGPIRILLVICRPGGRDDVPFRSVASRLVKGLSEDTRALFQLDVLRPPTFEQLGRTLRRAKANGKPYHIVHFDGHGGYVNVTRSGSHTRLLFENPVAGDNRQLVDGTALGKLLAETGVPVLVLNACRSAYANPPPAPVAAESNDDDLHTQVRAFGSLAQEVMDAGATGVVAMRYNVYVATATQFVADLYGELIMGRTLGEAVTFCRKQLADNPLRDISYEPRKLQDWSVPVVYEAAPISIFPAPDTSDVLTIALNEDQGAPSRADLDPNLPKIPDAGFFGRDETLLALDRAFDTQKIVLLHAYAGSGKTVTAAEFARWYALTRGVPGPVLFTSFENYQPLVRVLDRIGDTFGSVLEPAGVHWLALDDESRRNVAMQVLKQKPVLWVWDNVEPVTGFPAGTESAWNKKEQEELSDFLRDCKETKAKFLLTSRRDERAWLGENLPARITIPPMPMWERVHLARAIAEKHGRRLTDVESWLPLLDFTQGNPLTLTVVVGQALRDGLETLGEIEDFVERLRAGEAAFDDEVSEGRSKSLGASLSYGFDHAFSEGERRQLALLHFFQGFVNVGTLGLMGGPEFDWCLPEVRGMTREAGIALLDRATEIGLLTAIGGGCYTIHPALPWFFKSLFDKYYAPTGGGKQEMRATRAFVEAMGDLGNYRHRQYNAGYRDVIAALTAEEANMLHARKLARKHGWYRVIGTMQGLHTLYTNTGRWVEWARLVDEIVPDFVDPETDGPLLGREGKWSLITEYRVHLAREARDLAKAERLQRTCLDWDRKHAASSLAMPPEMLDDDQHHDIKTLASSLEGLGDIQRELKQAECVELYEESLTLWERLGGRIGVNTCAFNIGNAYMDIPTLRNLDQAERWYQRSLEMHYEHDRLGRARCLVQLGAVAFERSKEVATAEELLQHLNNALQRYQQALGMLPPDAVGDLAVLHDRLGTILITSNFDRASSHFREAIRYAEMQDNIYEAAITRHKFALALAFAGRFEDALDYARAALHNFETSSDGTAEEIQRTRESIALIEQAQQE